MIQGVQGNYWVGKIGNERKNDQRTNENGESNLGRVPGHQFFFNPTKLGGIIFL